MNECLLDCVDEPEGACGTSIFEVERDGRVESIRATRGPETGMKWLVDKSDCLTIRTGEGFCRD